MKPATTFAHLALCLGTMTSIASAWPTWMEEMHLVARQDDGEDNADAEPTPTPSPSEDQEEDEPRPTGKATNRLNTAKTLDPDNPPEPTKTGGSSRGNSTEKEEFDPRSPAGSLVMITPDPLLGNPLYKAGDMISWTWNYTNLLAEPTAIDVLLSCAEVSSTWTLTANMTFETPATFTWDSKRERDDPQAPLLTEEYTLVVKDSDADISATPEPGYLKNSDWKLDIYLPKKYTPLSEWNCATCNSAASSDLDQKALGFAMTMSLITILSFTWFVAGLRL